MKTFYIRSFSKINLSLRVTKRLKSGYHNIESLVTFANLFDIIGIKEINYKEDRIRFYGKFKKGINEKNNSIKKTIELFKKNNFLKGKNFSIKIKKNIPQGAGLGGGSMNSSTLINFFLLKYKLKISEKKLLSIARKIGFDVPLGLKIKNTILLGNSKNLVRTNKKLNLYLVLAYPMIKCETEDIYSKNKRFSKPYLRRHIFNNNSKKLFNLNNLAADRNDLQGIVFTLYPKIQFLNNFIEKQEKCIFSRMTGSGSTCVGFFNTLIGAQKAKNNIMKKFPNYWCEIAKTI